jgi:hypothetical protein
VRGGCATTTTTTRTFHLHLHMRAMRIQNSRISFDALPFQARCWFCLCHLLWHCGCGRGWCCCLAVAVAGAAQCSVLSATQCPVCCVPVPIASGVRSPECVVVVVVAEPRAYLRAGAESPLFCLSAWRLALGSWLPAAIARPSPSYPPRPRPEARSLIRKARARNPNRFVFCACCRARGWQPFYLFARFFR